ncbi:MAG: DNA mismatch repair endonuclease MutL [Elusimicrobia bacterium]|nr:DNA mismatch repair endonuclease MutL [Candidatus Obscuribacterium magneticum]
MTVPRIHLLPDELVARIAAGEVVERPASVLKELIENSLDAEATDIAVAIDGAGRTRLSVSDNGHGMTVEEAKLALQRHATSKINRLEDLESLGTFGFRGEALPSIASVSRLRLLTRSVEEETGWELLLEGGKLVSEKPVARELGTTVDVRDIFFNTPARFKFLKSELTERSQCVRLVEEMVFSSPRIRFELTLEKGRPQVFNAHEMESPMDVAKALRARIMEAWGPKWGRGLELVAVQSPHFKLTGVVTNQGHHQSTPRHQIFYVNRRPVQNRRLARAVYEAYRGQLPSLRHPGWVLFLEVHPQTVDINVHPAKREVKLAHESEIYGFLMKSVQEVLSRTEQVPVKLYAPAAIVDSAGSVVSLPRRELGGTVLETRSAPAPEEIFALKELYRPLADQPQGLGAKEAIAQTGLRQQEIRPLAQVGRTYILAESPQGLMVFDQHAAAEKVIYEGLFLNLKTSKPYTQMLLVPFSWEVSMSVAVHLKPQLNILQNLGFQMESFGSQTFLVKGYPSVLGEKFDLHSLLDGLSDVLMEPDEAVAGQSFEHRLAAMLACKSAVKAGDALDMKEGQKLIQDLFRCEAPFTCPHGRPTVVEISLSDLARKFRR